jgi:hypothetical protein
MAHVYSDYLSVDSDFIPVFSVFSDRDYPTKWKSFFPHDSFKSILGQLADTLEMGSIEKNRSLWMYGAYGTGKTFASFVIKHMLEDDLDQVHEYCDINNLRPLFARFAGIRAKGKTLVVHRSSSAGVIGQNRLFNCIIESVKEALRNNDCEYMGQRSQYEAVLSNIKDPDAAFNFDHAFKKYKLKFDGYATPASVIKDLEELPIEDSTDLLEAIIEIAELEHFFLSTSVHDLIGWLDDVIKGNQLYAIVFIWDEFTEFFKNNQNNLTGLQEIAQASPSIKFYLLLITHSGAEIIHDMVAKKIIEARFKTCPIEMADTTAFMLMGQAIKLNPDLIDAWSKITDDLWARVERSTRNVLISRSPEIKDSELQRLLPIHPYTAYLLKVISKDISSNQRTMFQFLSGDYGSIENPKTNFRWFIENHSNTLNGWNYLTVDFLWMYFFTEENVDLDTIFKTAMSQFNTYRSICGEDENQERVLQVVLLLSAMQQKSGATRAQGASGLLRPTLSNIALAFLGTPIENRVEQTLALFVQKGIFGKVEENGETLFVPPAGTIDQERWNTLRMEVLQHIPFEKILLDSNYAVYEQFKMDGYLTSRCEIYPVTSREYQHAVTTMLTLKHYKIPVLYIFSKDENDRTRVKPVIDKIINTSNRKVVVVDFSGQVFTEQAYDRFIDEKTNERYYTNNPNHVNQLRMAQLNARRIIDEWKQKLTITSLAVYPHNVLDIRHIQGASNLRKLLKEINNSWFGCGLEEIAINDRLFSTSGYSEDFAQMAMGKKSISANFAYTKDISSRLVHDQIWNDPQYWKIKPTHPVSRMKAKVEDVIQAGFQNYRKIAVTEIWHALQEPPFGLSNCQGSVFLLGFLLKEYADSCYYKNDGANTVPLNYTDLSSLIYAVVKELPKAQNQYIVRQTPEQIEFCKLTGEIFKIPREKRNSVEDVGKNISIFLSNNQIPLWSLKSYLEYEHSDHSLDSQAIKAIDLYCEFVSTNQIAGRDRIIIAKDIYELCQLNPTLSSFLANIVTIENLRTGMGLYIISYKPDINMVVHRLGIQHNEMISALIDRLSPDSSYLWEVGDTNQQIDNLYNDYKLIDSINVLLPEKKRTIEEARRALELKLGIIKLPEPLILRELPNLKPILSCIQSIIRNEDHENIQLINILNAHSAEFIEFFNNQYIVFSATVKKEFNFQISNVELEYLFSCNDGNEYSRPADKFFQQIKYQLDDYRKKQKINQLLQTWVDRTGTKSPEAWSIEHLIPIISLFQTDNNNALVSFSLINQRSNINMDEELIDQAIGYIKSDALNILADLPQCNLIFREVFGRDYAYIIDDIEELKKSIAHEVGSDADKWMTINRQSVEKCVEKYAKHQYDTVYRQKVKEKIRSLSPERAQEYLSQLIEDKPLVGINILRDQE